MGHQQFHGRPFDHAALLPGVFGEPGGLAVLARLGLLRSYVLSSGDRPCAIVLGYQYHDIFHYAEIAFDQSFSDFSP